MNPIQPPDEKTYDLNEEYLIQAIFGNLRALFFVQFPRNPLKLSPMAREGPGLICWALLRREKCPNLGLVLPEERPPNLGFSRFPHLEGVVDPALLNLFANVFSVIKSEIP